MRFNFSWLRCCRQDCACVAGKISEFIDGSPCSFVAVIDMAYMVYFVFFGGVLAPLVVMFAVYVYIYSVVRRHIVSIAAMMPLQAVAVATVQQQDPAVSQPSSSTIRHVTFTVNSNSEDVTAPTTHRGRTLSTLIKKHQR